MRDEGGEQEIKILNTRHEVRGWREGDWKIKIMKILDGE